MLNKWNKETYMEDNRTFGTIIRSARLERRKKDASFSLRKFAKRINISPTYLSKAETDEFTPPRAETVILIAEGLGIDPYFLLEKARKIHPDLKKILLLKQVQLSPILRLADKMSPDQISRLTDYAKSIINGAGT